MMKISFFSFFSLAVLSLSSLASLTNLELATDRPGADYKNFDVFPDYNICKNACEDDYACQAFTYVHPGVQGPSARCWLKTAAPHKVASGCCYSGTKRVTKELGWDRPGSDYRNFDLPFGSTVDTCARHCDADPRCLAYTFVHPNKQGPRPRCWLKNRVPDLVANPACDSGLVNWR